MFILPKNGEPKWLVRSYWNKVTKKNCQEKFYVFKWPKEKISELIERLNLLNELIKKQNIPNRPQRQVRKDLKLIAFYKININNFKVATKQEVKLKREACDRRRSGQRGKPRHHSEVNFYNVFLRYFDDKKMHTILNGLVNDPKFGPIENWPQERKERVRLQFEPTKKLFDKFYDDLM